MRKFFQLLLIFGIASCASTKNTSVNDDGKISINFLQINDVYEIIPLEGGKTGGMARVATIKKQHLQQNPNTYMLIAGDFLSPSVYNGLRYEGRPIIGRQMVDAMNAAGVDLAIFGNHEFDLKKEDLQLRLNESSFEYISSNAFEKTTDGYKPFEKQKESGNQPIEKVKVLEVTDADGTKARIGIIGIMLTNPNESYVYYTSPLETVAKLYDSLAAITDAVIAITHQEMEADRELAQAVPGLLWIAGGHEHDMRYDKIGNVLITKAHANAKTVYSVNIEMDIRNKTNVVTTKLIAVNASIDDDPEVVKVVNKWNSIAGNSFGEEGFDIKEKLFTLKDSLEARDIFFRTSPTNFGNLICKAIANDFPHADAVIFNSGSVRLDDILSGELTQFDILRSLPYGGKIFEADIKGEILIKALNTANNIKGSGGYLQSSFDFDPVTNLFLLKGEEINPSKMYRIALSQYLFEGKELHLEFLKPDNQLIIDKYPHPSSMNSPGWDIRHTLIKYIRENKNSLPL